MHDECGKLCGITVRPSRRAISAPVVGERLLNRRQLCRTRSLNAASHYNDVRGNADANTKHWRVAGAVQLHRRDRPTDRSPTKNVCQSLALNVGRSAPEKRTCPTRLPDCMIISLTSPLLKRRLRIMFVTSCKH